MQEPTIVKVKLWVSVIRIALGLVCPFSMGILIGVLLIPWVLAYYFDFMIVFKHLDSTVVQP